MRCSSHGSLCHQCVTVDVLVSALSGRQPRKEQNKCKSINRKKINDGNLNIDSFLTNEQTLPADEDRVRCSNTPSKLLNDEIILTSACSATYNLTKKVPKNHPWVRGKMSCYIITLVEVKAIHWNSTTVKILHPELPTLLIFAGVSLFLTPFSSFPVKQDETGAKGKK